jgi:methionyl-tRNA formyltransferase
MNVHASYLPKFRGAAPINRAIMSGEKETGLTTFFLQDKADTGNILLQQKVEIYDYDNAGTLHDRLSVLGAELLLKSLKLIETGKYELQEQDDSLATKAPKIFKEDCLIHWEESSEKIHNQIRGLSPYPAAFTHLNGKVFKIFKSRIIFDEQRTFQNSEFGIQNYSDYGKIHVKGKQLFVQTADNLLELFEIQMEGKKRISIGDFLNGADKNSLLKFK